MKKYIVGAATLALAVAPIFAHAATFAAQEEYSTGPQARIAGNLYVAAGSIAVGSAVPGDVFAAGNSVSVTGAVAGDIFGGGATVQLLSPVQGDVRVAAGQFSVNSRINGDLIVFGGTVNILTDAVINGGVYAFGGQVVIDGRINGPVQVRGGRLAVNGTVNNAINAKLDESLSFGPNARVNGVVTYRAPREAVMAEGAVVNALEYTPHKGGRDADAKHVAWVALGALTGIKLFMLLGLAAVLVWRWRRETLEILQDASDRFWGSAGHGIVYGIGIPLCGLLLLVSIVGTMAGGIVLSLFAAMVIVSKAMMGMFLGAWLWSRARKGSVLHLDWSSALGGVIILQLIGMLPVIGWLVSTVLNLVVFGALARRVQRAL